MQVGSLKSAIFDQYSTVSQKWYKKYEQSYYARLTGTCMYSISEIVNYLGQVTSEVKWDNFRFVARETMFVNKQMYA